MNNGTFGKFIVIEGLDGAGKSSIVNRLKKEKLKNTVFTCEPGGTEYGEKLRDILLCNDMHGKISIMAEILGFCSARANHCDLFIRPMITKGINVICDRFDASTIAYQISANYFIQVYDLFIKINNIAKGEGIYGIIEPDKVIYLDVDPTIALSRSKARGVDNGKFDKHRIDFYYRIRESYLIQYNSDKNNKWSLIDASRLFDDVYKDVKKIIDNLIK